MPAGSAWRSLAALHPAWLFSLWALGPRCRAWTWSWWAVATACRWSRRDSPQVTLNTLTHRSPWTLAVYPLHFQSVLPSCFQRNVFVFKAPSTDLRNIQLIFKIFFLSVSISIPVILILFCSWPIIESLELG